MNRRRRAVMIAASGLALVALTAGCSGYGYDEQDSKAAAAARDQAQQQDSGRVVARTALRVTDDSKLGAIVTDAEGFAVYRFDGDDNEPPKSTCKSGCAATWPPVLANGELSIDGGDAALLGTMRRADGTEQVTLDGWALYRFVNDKRPGDTNGQGVGGTWFVAAPDGKKAKAAAALGGGEPSGNGGGSGASTYGY